jgi:hypothetical protein
MPRRIRSIVALVCLSLAALLAAASAMAAKAPVAHSARSCSPPKYPGSGYFTRLSVYGTSCSTGRKVAIAYYHCRLRHGKRGKCTSRVLGYSCRERRQSIPTEIDATVTCKRGHRKVVHSYQQNL